MYEDCYGIEKLEPGQNIPQLSSWQKVCSRVFPYETRDVCFVEDMIHSVAAHIGSFATVWIRAASDIQGIVS